MTLKIVYEFNVFIAVLSDTIGAARVELTELGH